MGAVTALKQLEAESHRDGPNGINMSTIIEAQFSKPANISSFHGVLLFYGIVLFLLVAGAMFCLAMHWEYPVSTSVQAHIFEL